MRALVLSGGGVGGAYQAGAIKRLIHEGNTYDLYVGVSVGAINASFLAQFPYGAEGVGSCELWEIWWAIRPESVYRKWAGGILGAIPAAWHGSLYDSSPIQRLIDERLHYGELNQSNKQLRVQAVSVEGSILSTWTQRDKDICEAVKASCAFPKIFSPVTVRGQSHMDGAVVNPIPIDLALSEGAIEIDVISTSIEDVINTPKVRRIISPKKNPARHPFDFRPKVVHALMAMGYEDAIT